MPKSIESLSHLQPADQELVALLQNLVRIPSWVPENSDLKKIHNENAVVDFLEDWARANTTFEIIRQPLEGGRYNLILKKGRPDLVFLAHTDTVTPSENAPYDQLAAEVHDAKIWGRGTTDMKSGIATMIQALSLKPQIDNTWMFLYADEEYDFLGMKALVEEYSHIRPQMIVSSDGSDLRLGHGCRGLIEIRAQVEGATGHPAKATGRSAIWEGFEVLATVRNKLLTQKHEVMGSNSFSVAYMLGGANQPDNRNEYGFVDHVGQAGNVVPDIMEFVLDVRPAFPNLNLQAVVDLLAEEFETRRLGFQVVREKHNLGAWYTDASELKPYEKIARQFISPLESVYSNPQDSGYLDLQMLWEAVDRPTAFMYGGGVGETAHTPKEHIKIDNLIKERDFFLGVLALHIMNQT